MGLSEDKLTNKGREPTDHSYGGSPRMVYDVCSDAPDAPTFDAEAHFAWVEKQRITGIPTHTQCIDTTPAESGAFYMVKQRTNKGFRLIGKPERKRHDAVRNFDRNGLSNALEIAEKAGLAKIVKIEFAEVK